MYQVESAIQKVTHTSINGTPVIKYMVPTWNKTTKQTTWITITAWNPEDPEQYRNGRKATITYTRKPKRIGGFFYNQQSIEFAKKAIDAQMSLPGM